MVKRKQRRSHARGEGWAPAIYKKIRGDVWPHTVSDSRPNHQSTQKVQRLKKEGPYDIHGQEHWGEGGGFCVKREEGSKSMQNRAQGRLDDSGWGIHKHSGPHPITRCCLMKRASNDGSRQPHHTLRATHGTLSATGAAGWKKGAEKKGVKSGSFAINLKIAIRFRCWSTRIKWTLHKKQACGRGQVKRGVRRGKSCGLRGMRARAVDGVPWRHPCVWLFHWEGGHSCR